MTEPVRFPANVPYDKWPDAARCYELMINGEWAELQNYFNMHRQNITDSIGAVNYWRDQFVPPDGYPVQVVMENGAQAWLIPGQSPKRHTFQPGVLYLWKADGAGQASGSLDNVVYMGGMTQPYTEPPTPVPNPFPNSGLTAQQMQTVLFAVTTNAQVGFINLGAEACEGRVDIRVA